MAPVTPLDARLATALSDRYRIERPLGAGGMATVYLATDLKHDREVALKVLRPELGAVLGTERFLAEIKITARLDHPHILTLIDSGEVGGLLYYVLPLVRGESLRDVLNREKQLGLDQALLITRQVASALDFAHRHGVIHRDIKPENILLQEGEAMLADFGIALAVKEAGGNRLTETGLSLGTPQYMSPEQATGDRMLDARSDVYSLAAVLYEMLAGEPPVTGTSAQAMIAKLMTERPTHLRVVRPSVPESIDAAVSKALDKTPADRFASAGDFMKALTVPSTTGTTPTVPVVSAAASTRRPVGMIAAALLVGLAIGGFFLLKNKGGRPLSTRIALKDRVQATFSGNVWGPVMSADGKQIAFGTKACTGAGCIWSVEIQDVGATSSRKIFEGATAAYGLEWSPDRRYLLCAMTYQGRFGTYLLNILGGAPRFLTAGPASFYAGGDSLLIGPPTTGASFAVQVRGINGTTTDSVIVNGPGSLATLISIPGTSRFIALVVQNGQGLWQVIDRQGHVTDKLLNSCTCGGAASHDAIWMQRAGEGAGEAIVRVALDPTTGRLAAAQDTAYYGAFTGVSVTADGSQFMVDDGAESYASFAGTLSDMVKGKFPATPLVQASSPVDAKVSSDGARLLIIRFLPAGSGLSETRLTVRPYDGGTETAIPVSGRFRNANWTDSVTLAIVTMDRGQTHFSQVDVRNGQVRNRLDVPDSTMFAAAPLADGWAWIPSAGDRIVISEGGKERSIPKPDWMMGIVNLRSSPDKQSVAYNGFGVTQDSVRFDVAPIAGGAGVPWTTAFAERTGFDWRPDGSLLVVTWIGPETIRLDRVTAPNKSSPLGTIPHAVERVSIDQNNQRMTITWSDRKGDAWLYKVGKP